MRLFSITRKNRRRDADFVFAVKSGAGGSGGKVARVRWWVKPLLGLVAMLILVGAGRWGMQLAQDHWLHRIRGLAIQRVAVFREGLLSEDEVRRLAGVDPGRNALTVDLYQVRQSLLRHPRIEEARVEIEFPDVLRVSVRERIPVARLVLPPLGSAQAYYLIDEQGAVFLPFRRGDAPPEVLEAESALPNLVGLSLAGLVSGSRIRDERALSALRLLSEFERSPMLALADLVEIDISETDVLKLLTRGGSRVVMATQRDHVRQLEEWFSVCEFGRRQGLAISELDLSVTNHPPLRWAEPGTVSPEPQPRVRTPKRKNTRRHV